MLRVHTRGVQATSAPFHMHEYPIVLASLMLSNNKISAGAAAADQVEVELGSRSSPRAMWKEGMEMEGRKEGRRMPNG